MYATSTHIHTIHLVLLFLFLGSGHTTDMLMCLQNNLHHHTRTLTHYSLPGTRGVYPSCSWQEEQSEQEERDEERGMSPHHVTEWEPLPLPQVQIVSQNLHLCISFSRQKVVIPVDLCTLLLWTLLPSVFTPDDTAHKEVYKVIKLPHVLCTSYYSASTAIPIPRLCTVP